MNNGLTQSEKIVAKLCSKAFLSLWTHPNPYGKKDKELCDCLIVCGKHIIIISVKEIKYIDTDNHTGYERWTRAAIEKSIKQIYGAERFLKTVKTIKRKDNRIIKLAPHNERIYHRVSVSLGANGAVPVEWGDFGNGFVHICTEKSLDVVFKNLDTISDFIDFLCKTENLFSSKTCTIFNGGGIEDLVAIYLNYGNSFSSENFKNKKPDMFLIDGNIWNEYSKSERYKSRTKSLEKSYHWDRLIEFYIKDLLTYGMFDMFSKKITRNELALISMALQPRHYREELAKAFLEFLSNHKLNISSRIVLGANETGFVFCFGPSNKRELRAKELYLRAFVARGKLEKYGVNTIIGIATDKPGTSVIGYSSDILYLNMPTWSEEDEAKSKGIQEDLNYFKSPIIKKRLANHST